MPIMSRLQRNTEISLSAHVQLQNSLWPLQGGNMVEEWSTK